jgi:Mce-associated membrane protein
VKRLNAVLYVIALVLACASVVGGVMVWQEDDTQAEEQATQTQYGTVQEAATAEAEALINISYKDAQATFDKVLAGATGTFKKQYEKSTEGTAQLLAQNKSVMTGEVIWAGVSSIDDDSATVIAATKGKVANNQTNGQRVKRYFRLKLDLVYVDGKWLTDNLEFLS